MRPLGRHFSLFSRYKGFFHPMHPTAGDVASSPAIARSSRRQPVRLAAPIPAEALVEIHDVVPRPRPAPHCHHLWNARTPEGAFDQPLAITGLDHRVARLARQPVLDALGPERIVERRRRIPPHRARAGTEVADGRAGHVVEQWHLPFAFIISWTASSRSENRWRLSRVCSRASSTAT